MYQIDVPIYVSIYVSIDALKIDRIWCSYFIIVDHCKDDLQWDIDVAFTVLWIVMFFMYQSLLIDLSIDVLDIDIMNLLTYTAMHAIYSIMPYQ